MKYLIDNKAKFPWIEVLDVSVHTRASPDGANITNSQVDPSRTRITPGEQYAHTFTIAAPRDPGEYLVVMFWQTFSPACSAYGI